MIFLLLKGENKSIHLQVMCGARFSLPTGTPSWVSVHEPKYFHNS